MLNVWKTSDNMDIEKIRSMFPSLETKVMGKPLVYLDNTATSQTPRLVVDDVVDMYMHRKANVHRGVHTLSQEATARQEATRERVRRYINADSVEEVVFTRGTTEAINLVASSYGALIPDGSEIILTVMEHHANIVPWQLLAQKKGLVLKVVDIDSAGQLDMEQYRSLFSERTAMAAFCHVSNVLGTVNPVEEMTRIAHGHGAVVLVDGAQASPHLAIDVKALGCDFYVFSSHKMYGPTGVGVLYGRKELLESMPPYQGGGEMIKHVSFSGTTYADLPFKFEAGTPDFVDIAAFGRAVDFLEGKITCSDSFLADIARHEMQLTHHVEERVRRELPQVKIYGEAAHKGPVISFNVGDVHPYDIGMLLDGLGIAVRTGHHCAQPLMDRLGIPGTVRASFACYNTMAEADYFVDSLVRVASMF